MGRAPERSPIFLSCLGGGKGVPEGCPLPALGGETYEAITPSNCEHQPPIPSLSRQTGMGLTALVGRLGGSLAPLVALLDGVWLSLPKLTYGGIALLAACTALLLPETRQAQLPETIQDVERRRYVHVHVGMGVQVPDTVGGIQRKTCLHVSGTCMQVCTDA